MSLTKASYSMITGAPVNVKDFGAIGNGTTDDTAAIQAAINFCTNLSNRKQTLYFPANNAGSSYKITSSLIINGRLNIVGDGEFTTTILAFGMTAGQFILDFNNEAADVVYFGGMRQITVRSDNGSPTGIRLRNTSYWTFKNVQLYNLTTGIYVTGTTCFTNCFEQLTGYEIGASTVQLDNFTGGGQYMFSGCTFTGANGFVVTNTAATDALAFYDCNFEQCDVTDMFINGSVGGLTISGCRSEGLDGTVSFLIQPAAGKTVQGISITGCTWSSDSGNAYPISIGGSSGVIKGFSITGNEARYIGFNGFVNLNGAGSSGVISGNFCENSPVVANGAPRNGVVIYANSNSSGALPEYWGLADWGVEEGTWTPTDASGAGLTFTAGVAVYTKIGRAITIQCQMTFPATASTALVQIGGLPFALVAPTVAVSPIDSAKGGSAANVLARSDASLAFLRFVDAGNGSFFTNANFTTQVVSFSITYNI
jgi:hypothetical protein